MDSETHLFDSFGLLLHERVEHATFTTEDAIRYTFFHALVTAAGYRPVDISLEEPLSYHPGRRIDTVVYDRLGRREMLIEFKYHRMRKASQPKPQLAGGLYCDLFRLAFAQAKSKAKAYLVYVTDREMAKYLSQARHGCQNLFCLSEGSELTLDETTLGERRKTFVRALHGFLLYPAVIRCVYRRDFSNGEELVVFSVTHVPHDVYNWN